MSVFYNSCNYCIHWHGTIPPNIGKCQKNKTTMLANDTCDHFDDKVPVPADNDLISFLKGFNKRSRNAK